MLLKRVVFWFLFLMRQVNDLSIFFRDRMIIKCSWGILKFQRLKGFVLSGLLYYCIINGQ